MELRDALLHFFSYCAEPLLYRNLNRQREQSNLYRGRCSRVRRNCSYGQRRRERKQRGFHRAVDTGKLHRHGEHGSKDDHRDLDLRHDALDQLSVMAICKRGSLYSRSKPCQRLDNLDQWHPHYAVAGSLLSLPTPGQSAQP